MDDPATGLSMADYEYCKQPTAPAVLHLLRYWNDCRGDRFAPARADIDPAKMTALLPDIHMFDVLDGGRDFRFRLVGTRIVEGVGRDSTGRRISELRIDLAVRQRMISRLARVVALRQPTFGRGRIHWLPDRAHMRFNDVNLPLSGDGATVDIILGALVIERG